MDGQKKSTHLMFAAATQNARLRTRVDADYSKILFSIPQYCSQWAPSACVKCTLRTRYAATKTDVPPTFVIHMKYASTAYASIQRWIGQGESTMSQNASCI